METFSRETLALEPCYITGFSESAAAFTYSRNEGGFNLYFAIKLSSGDRALLEAIRTYFGGAGNIYAAAPGGSYYRVSRSADLLAITRHFDAHPLKGSKAGAYAVWREMVYAKQRFRKTDRDQLERLALVLSAVRPGKRSRR